MQTQDSKTTLVYVMDKSGEEEPVWLKSRSPLDQVNMYI
jgi:hypothetical protein